MADFDSLQAHPWHGDSSSSATDDDAEELLTLLQQSDDEDNREDDGNDETGDRDEDGNDERGDDINDESDDEESSIESEELYESEEFYQSDSSCDMMSVNGVQSDDEDFESITDEEDQEAFQHWDKKWYRMCIRPIKRSRHNFNLCPVWLRDGYNRHDTTAYFSEKVCKQLGRHLFKNDQVIKIDLSDLKLTDSCVGELFLPWKHDDNDGRAIVNDQRIKELHLCCNPMIGPSGIRRLVPFLRTNSNLHVLKLSNVNMGLDGARVLSSVFEDKSNYMSCILDHLDVSGNGLGDAAVELLSRALRNVTTLKKLDLSFNDIEGYLCVSPLLEDLDHQSPSPSSSSSTRFSLRKLFLYKNNLNDDFITPLSQALRRDKVLTKIDLSQNPRITEDGWNSLLNVVCNTSSISSLFESNHTIKSFGYLPLILHIEENMTRALNANNVPEWTSLNIGRQKIIAHYFSIHSPLCHEVLGIDTKLMPKVFALLGNEHTFESHDLPHHAEVEPINQEEQKIASIWKIASIYRIIRNWNMPSLFSYPSCERAQMDSYIRKVDVEKDAIQVDFQKSRDDSTNLKRKHDDLKHEIFDFEREDKRLYTI